MKQALGRRHCQQRAYFSRTARLAEDRDIVWIASEVGDIVAHPFQGCHHVQHAYVAGIGELCSTDFGKIQKAERVEPVIHGHRHNVVLARHIRAVVHGVTAVAAGKSAAVQPNHHGPLVSVQAVSPDVQMKAVLADG